MRSTRSGRRRRWGSIDSSSSRTSSLRSTTGVLLAVDELHRRSDERQVGDQGAQCAVDRDERPREQHDVGGQAHAEAGERGDQLLEDGRIDRRAGPHVVGQQPSEGALQLVGRRRVGELGDPLDTVAEQADVAPGEGDHDVDDGGLLDRVEPSDRAEVDQAEPAVGEDEHVARVRIGVEHADADDLVEGGAQQNVGEGLTIHGGLRQPTDVGDRDSFEALLDEDPSRREMSVHGRDPHRRVVRASGRPSRASRPLRDGSRAPCAGPWRTGRAVRPSGHPDRTACAAGPGWRGGRVRRDRAPSSPRCPGAAP